jgi:outer membrane immunogenic protein
LSAATTSGEPRSIAQSLEDAMAKTIWTAGLAALVLMSAAARAADFAPYAPPSPRGVSWQGPYVGANLGYQWSSVGNNSARPNGVAGGVQAGYNVQYSQFVFGGETDLQVTDADATFAAWKFSNPWFGSLRARAGFAINNVLFYGTVGLAYGTLKMQSAFTPVSESHIGTGWAGGAGAEIALMPHWSARAEYLYVDLGGSSFVLDGNHHGIQSNLLRLGVNYRF